MVEDGTGNSARFGDLTDALRTFTCITPLIFGSSIGDNIERQVK